MVCSYTLDMKRLKEVMSNEELSGDNVVIDNFWRIMEAKSSAELTDITMSQIDDIMARLYACCRSIKDEPLINEMAASFSRLARANNSKVRRRVL